MNAIGQRTAVDVTLDADVNGAALTSSDFEWKYNATGELIESDHENGVTFDSAYAFDGIGNRDEAVTGTTTLTGTDNYTANKLNEYTEVNGVNLPAGAYDGDGNLVNDGTLTYHWNGENRLIKVTDGTNTLAEYIYDYLGRRIAKETTTHAPQGPSNHAYFYRGWNLAIDYKASSSWISWDSHFAYTWGLDLSGSLGGAGGVGGLLVARKISGTYGTYYPTYDGNGNVSEYLDANGTQVAHYEYGPFGGELVSTGSLKDIFTNRFSTKPLDEESGFYYFGYRYYQPNTGRWLSRDPIGERGGVNLYAMVRNNAVNRVDRLGLRDVELTVITFIPDEYVYGPGRLLQDSLVGDLALYKGDGDPKNKSINRKTYRTKHTVKVTLPETDEEIAQLSRGSAHFAGTTRAPKVKTTTSANDSVRYKRQPKIGKWQGNRGDVWYDNHWFDELERKKSKVKTSDGARIYGSDLCAAKIQIHGRAKDPVVPFTGGDWFTPHVDYRMTAKFSRRGLARKWRFKGIEGKHDGFPAYLFFVDGVLVHEHSPDKTGEGVFSMYGRGEHEFDTVLPSLPDPNSKFR